MKLTIACAQTDNTLGNLAVNIRKHLEFIRRARDGEPIWLSSPNSA